MIHQVSWDEFKAKVRWTQGEHATFVGPTGSGKTTLAVELLDKMPYVVVIATKPDDPVVWDFARRGYRITNDELLNHEDHPRQVLWPPFDIDSSAHQQRVVERAIKTCFVDGGWTIYIDEVPYLSKVLGLKGLLEVIWMQARAVGVSLCVSMQRPVGVPREAFSQASHVFLWNTGDARDLETLREMGNCPSGAEQIVQRFSKHRFLYVNNAGDAVTSKVQPTRSLRRVKEMSRSTMT